MPAVMDIRAHLPSAQIDWVVERAFAPLLAVAPSVNKVIACDIRRWRKSWWTHQTRREFMQFKRQLQNDSYDAIIDLQGLSKSAFISWLAELSPKGKRFAIGNQTQGASYEPMTRWVADTPVVVHTRVHAVERSRIICSKALNYAYLSQAEGVTSTPASPSALHVKPAKAVQPQTIALVHASSREDKTWPLSYWTELGEGLMQRGFQIALPQGSEDELEQARKISNTLVGSKVWLKMSLDNVTAHLAACAGVIGVDSGLSHIAEALDLPLVQIYNFPTNWRTGPIRQAFQTSTYAEPTPSVEDVLKKWDESWSLFQNLKDKAHQPIHSLPIQNEFIKPSVLNTSEAQISELVDQSLLGSTSVLSSIESKNTSSTSKSNSKKNSAEASKPSPQLGLFD